MKNIYIIMSINNINIFRGKFHETGYNLKNFPMLCRKKAKIAPNFKMRCIQNFTSNNKLLNLWCNVKGVKLKRINTDMCEIDFGNESIKFSLISDLFINDNSDVIALKKQLLNAKKRSGLCHYQSVSYLNSWGNKIVTGYVDDTIASQRDVHSWIETDINVIDYSKNLVISKDDYYRLLNPEVINEITKDELNCDIELLRNFSFLSCKFYCLFRDEIINDLINKNNAILSDIGYEKKLK